MKLILLIINIMVIFSAMAFFIGFHNVDIAHNMEKGQIDIGLNGNAEITKTDAYLNGIRLMIASFIILLSSHIWIFIYFSDINE